MGVRALIEEMKRVLFICALLFAAALCEDKPDAPADEADDMSGDPKVDGKKEMAEMDTNKDGKATLEEIEAFMKARYYTKAEDLKDLQNDDGKPATADDIKKMITRDASELLKELDKDESKDLNVTEVIAQYQDTGDDMPDEEGGEEDDVGGEDDPEASPEEAEDAKEEEEEKK